MSDLSAYGSSIQGLKEQAQSCRVGRSPSACHLSPAHMTHTRHQTVYYTVARPILLSD